MDDAPGKGPRVLPLYRSSPDRAISWITGNSGGGTMALLSPQVTRVTLKHPPASYAEIAESPDYNWPLSAMPPGVLADFDLPDCYRVLNAKDRAF